MAVSHAEQSWVMTRFRRAGSYLQRAVHSSGLATLGRRLANWTRHSFLYRWLTAEPDPEVIVIDLRETYTVGPILALLDRLITPLVNAWQTAGTGSLAQTLTDALRAHPIRTVSLVAVSALLTEIAVSLTMGTLSSTAFGLRLLVLVIAALGTRIRLSWEQCTESVTYRYLVAALEPPEPPESNKSDSDSER
ncbi:hypothetical protein [Salinibaculum rarum]|uniref:hypothetical protein n=1 Tax=Salinibaculum rarum TaxID=3058903 RepID=UPI00265EB99B|nr:hypothetical protein [Salinibaculum sp. KK48]